MLETSTKKYILMSLFGILLTLTASFLSAEEVSYLKSTEAYKKIKSAIEQIRIIDDHEHLPPESVLLKNGAPDFFDIAVSTYVESDISIIGNTFPHDDRFLDKLLPMEERWKSFQPLLARMKNTGYWRSTALGLEKVHNIKIKDAQSVEKINKSLEKIYRPGIYRKILYELGKIDCVFIYEEWDKGFPAKDYPEFFRGVRYIDDAIIFTMPKHVYDLEKRYHTSIRSLDDLEKVYKKFVNESVESGVIGFKSAAAYIRHLDYSSYSPEKAHSLLKKLLTFTKAEWKRGQALTVEQGEDLINYSMNLMLKIIEESGKPISFHTGLQAYGENEIRRTNPQFLIPLFKKYKNLNFDLLHGGFPYVTQFVELGKSWPNVFLNLCWNHIISPVGARAQLSEMLECVPVNKIFAFGGDQIYPEQIIGHLEMAKENCALVLAAKVLDGSFTLKEAKEYAQRIFRTNLIEFFDLKLPER